MPDKVFLDSNVLLYLLSSDNDKASVTESLLEQDAVISVQVLNEITNVARNKLRMSWENIDGFIDTVRALCPVEPLTEATHDRARAIARLHGVSFYDANIVASALIANAAVLYSEDMHHGTIFEKMLRVVNPYQ